jgi:outer membrane scaffolding protein for murein synthesis (MipA/OmpV family)
LAAEKASNLAENLDERKAAMLAGAKASMMVGWMELKTVCWWAAR